MVLFGLVLVQFFLALFYFCGDLYRHDTIVSFTFGHFLFVLLDLLQSTTVVHCSILLYFALLLLYFGHVASFQFYVIVFTACGWPLLIFYMFWYPGVVFSSFLLFSQVRRLRESGKVVVASICNVAASGGYYIAMGCETIVCDELSITGSIGVVQAKFAAGEFLDKVSTALSPASQ